MARRRGVVGLGEEVTRAIVEAKRAHLVSLFQRMDQARDLCNIPLAAEAPYVGTRNLARPILAAPVAPDWASMPLRAQNILVETVRNVLAAHAGVWRDHYGCAHVPPDEDFKWPSTIVPTPPALPPREPDGGGGGRMIGPGGIDMRIVILLGLACLAREAQARRSEGDHLALMALGLALAPRS